MESKEKLILSGMLPKIFGALAIVVALIVVLYTPCPSAAMYFIIYTLIGVGIASILAKSAKSAHLKYKAYNIAVALTGGVALPFILFFSNPIDKFRANGCIFPTGVTVSVHGKKSEQEIILRKGDVLMDIIGKERKKASINENGQAFFPNIQVGDSVRLDIDFSEPYHSTNPSLIYKITPNCTLQMTAFLMGTERVSGAVQFNDSPLDGVIVKLVTQKGNLLDTTDSTGDFGFHVPDSMQMKSYQVWFIKKGFKSAMLPAYPETGQPLFLNMEKN